MSGMMNIKYVNSAGTTIELNQGKYSVSTHDLRDFSWKYTTTNRPSGYGGRVKFSKPVQEKTINLGVRGATAAELNTNATALHALTEVDILNNTPGKLYLGNQYLTCYLSTSSAVNYYSRRGNWLNKTATIVVTEPFWHTEFSQRFLLGAAATVANAKFYDGRYPYRYISNTSSGIIINSYYVAAPMIITIYDAADDPSITIGGNIYAMDATISDGQRIVINQLDRTIYAIASDGTKTNMFNYRDKTNDIFEYIQAGENTVIYTGDFTFDVTVIQQRSEPSWI